MMKLKNLFPNFEMATMIVKNWEYDDLDLFKYWRTSSNAIYPFKNGGEIHFLRIAPMDEKEQNSIMAELDFLRYLKDSNYNCIETKLSRNEKELEIINTPWGKFYAVVFKRVKGKALSDSEVTDDIMFLYGKAMGKLHKLSKSYKPVGNKRCTWEDRITWIKEVLCDFPEEKEAIKEADMLQRFFSSLPATDENYGLIHYDFEFDNIFHDAATNEIYPIDFDDSMYHWYAMDIQRSIDSIREEMVPERVEKAERQFLEGYRSELAFCEDMEKLLPLFQRFANLYGYVRVLRSAKEKWKNEPEWLDKLRVKLNNLLNKRKSMFGNAIE